MAGAALRWEETERKGVFLMEFRDVSPTDPDPTDQYVKGPSPEDSDPQPQPPPPPKPQTK